MKKIIVLLALFSAVVFAQQKGSFTDSRDGKKYKTVKIGTQVWMAENLDYAGKNRDIGACFGRKPENCKKYGALYNWEEAIKVCPSGWHLPDYAEWNILIDFAGGNENAGKKLRAKTGWYWENFEKGGFREPSNGTDDYGFTALSVGIPFDCNGGPGDYMGESLAKFFSCWWSATDDEARAYFRYMNSYSYSVNVEIGNKHSERSVRCVQGDAVATQKNKDEIDVVSTKSGLKYVVLSQGFGNLAKDGDTISIHYTGSLLDGTKFDSSYDRNQPLTITLGEGQLILGFLEMLRLMKEGDKVKAWIPSKLAYGEQGNPVIPGNSILVFEIELQDIKPANSKGIFSAKSLKDSRDGKEYKTAKIGNQTWMAENLNYQTEDSKCYDNKPENCKKYGRLYNWEIAKKVCPNGWHLPNNAEWDELYHSVDGTSGIKSPYKSKAVEKYLKAKNGWNDYNRQSGNGTDNFGFAALPGGYSYSGGYFYGASNGYWWSSSDGTTYYAYSRFMSYDNENVVTDGNAKTDLLSVRCLQD